jgi:dihydroxyacid dehydratase/phosphogluconate dehydratase
VTGRTIGEELDRADKGFAQDVVRPLSHPIYPQGGIAVLRGNLAPGRAIIKQSAAADPSSWSMKVAQWYSRTSTTSLKESTTIRWT